MSDAQYTHIDDDAHTLVRLCGYSPERARTELAALAYRPKVGLLHASRALEILVRTAVDRETADALDANWQRWRDILRSSENAVGVLAA